ncbi:MAG: hypothetical protein V4548_10470 [Bacteroidota bacterium]
MTKSILKIVLILCCFIAIILSYCLTEYYLTTNFLDLGEAYKKGEGHLLDENFNKGLFFIISRGILIFFFTSSILFLIFEKNLKPFLKFTLVIWGVILLIEFLYFGLKIYDVFYHDYENINRLIEMFTNILSEFSGFLLGYFVILKYYNNNNSA